jgi:hypothetical protein
MLLDGNVSHAKKKKALWEEIIHHSGFVPTKAYSEKKLKLQDCRGRPPNGCTDEA